MAKFRIGQRVRVRWDDACDGVPDMTGREGVVVLVTHDVDLVDSTHVGYDLCVDGYEYDPSIYFVEEQLEPITDSNELVSWESMRDLWVPEHLRIRA